MKNLCFIDIETTGAIFNYHEIIEVGAIKTTPDGATIIDSLNKRIKPLHPKRITKIAQEINGFTIENWKDAEKPKDLLWNKIIDFWNECIPICHNPSFERAFISISVFNAGINKLGLDYHWIGTESLAWPLYINGKIPKLSLSKIADYFDVPPEPIPHEALGGAHLCRSSYLKLIESII